jgi:hypothetical protein
MSSNTIELPPTIHSNESSTHSGPTSDTPYYAQPPLPPPPIIAPVDRPIQPDFSFHDTNTSNMIYTAYICVNKVELWDALANFNELSFMFCEDPVIRELMIKINNSYNGHSGASLAWTMRQLEHIAKYGYTKYRDLFNRNIISRVY